MTSHRFPAALALIVAAGVSRVALAHDSGSGSGLAHAFMGLDHLLAALGVGLLAVQQRRLWTIPATFVGLMLAGVALAALLPGLPGVELGIAGSVVLFGALAATAARLPKSALFAAVGGLALLHGHAHGAEGSGATFAAGLAASTLALHAAGAALALAARRLPGALDRAAGAAIAATGAALLFIA